MADASPRTALDDVLDDERHRHTRFVVYSDDPPTDVEHALASRNATVARRDLPRGCRTDFVVVERDGAFAGALGLAELRHLLTPPVVRPDDPDDAAPGYRALFDVLDDTVFTALTRRSLHVVSREIEERAYRVGRGALHVTFQTERTFAAQRDVYEVLCTETALDVHLYSPDEWTIPVPAGATYHETTAACAPYWALAFRHDEHACGLLAREEPDGFRGVWTDDAETVARIAAGIECDCIARDTA